MTMRSDVSSSLPSRVVIPKPKVSIWTLRDTNTNLPNESKGCQPSGKVSPPPSIESLITDRTKLDLSRAAKRAVLRQQQLVWKSKQKYNFRHLKSSQSARKTEKQLLIGKPRTEVYSAPPSLGKARLRDNLQTLQNPPKIVVVGASDNGSVQSQPLEKPRPATEESWMKKPLSSRQSTSDFTPRSAVSTDSSSFLGAYSPDARITDYTHRTFDETPRSRLSFQDWEWVHERLASRQSQMDRPDSSLTFYDFLETLNLDSDEYDTDLEDETGGLTDRDRTGVENYKKFCDYKGIAPAKQVVQKLSKEVASLSLNHRYLNSNDTRALASALSSNAYVQRVNLSGNCIDDEGAKSVFSILRQNTSITHLDISCNRLTNDKNTGISTCLKENYTLTHLMLSQNKLADKEALLMSEALRMNNTLECLDVSQNQISDIGGQSFAAALMDNVSLTSLNLSWNILGKSAASALGKALKINKTLQGLDVSYNGFGDEGTALFSRPFRHNATLRYLSLAVNHIGPFGAERLAVGICGSRKKGGKKSKCVVRSLNLSRNGLGKSGILTLLKHMEVKNSKLKDLRLESVILTEEALSLTKRLNSSLNLAIFYQRQRYDDKQHCAIELGRLMLSELLQLNGTTLENFFAKFTPNNIEISVEDFKQSLQDFRNCLSELEVDRLVSCIDQKCVGYIRPSDVLHQRSTLVRLVEPPEIQQRNSLIQELPSPDEAPRLPRE